MGEERAEDSWSLAMALNPHKARRNLCSESCGPSALAGLGITEGPTATSLAVFQHNSNLWTDVSLPTEREHLNPDRVPLFQIFLSGKVRSLNL